MENKKEKAIKAFRSGSNCAQSVLMAYAQSLDVDEKMALDIASGFGGGMGRLQETCGAVSASFMVIGIQHSKTYADEEIRKEKTIKRIQQFANKFKFIHETTNCATLLNCDLNTKGMPVNNFYI